MPGQVIGKPDFLPGSISPLKRDKKRLPVGIHHGWYLPVNLQNRVFVRFNREDGIDNDRFFFPHRLLARRWKAGFWQQ